MTREVAVVGLGYVGLPVAVAFAKNFSVIGFDLSQERVEQLQKGLDRTGEFTVAQLLSASNLRITDDPERLQSADVFIICVPTPVTEGGIPDLSYVEGAARTVAGVMKPGSLVIFESTVYPGATEKVFAPILESVSGLRLNFDFDLAFSPERINPGDSEHSFDNVVKVVSGSSEQALERVAELYSSVVSAGVHMAGSIQIAEAAKLVENTQRDLNIALVNELALMFNLMGIDTNDVLDAAATKWNFSRYKPGLVGGHCIGVDPNYLAFASKEAGLNPELISAARSINDSMAEYVVDRVLTMCDGGSEPAGGAYQVLVLGATFKENCPDTRNSQSYVLIDGLQKRGAEVVVVDPHVAEEARHSSPGLTWGDWEEGLLQYQSFFDAVVLAVPHREFLAEPQRLRSLMKESGALFDVKGALDREYVDGRL